MHPCCRLYCSAPAGAGETGPIDALMGGLGFGMSLEEAQKTTGTLTHDNLGIEIEAVTGKSYYKEGVELDGKTGQADCTFIEGALNGVTFVFRWTIPRTVTAPRKALWPGGRHFPAGCPRSTASRP
jgi:hypothetical protein